MGTKSHLEPQRFAEELRSYLWEHIEPMGSDRSGRWLEARTDGARSREYWRKVIAGTQAMTSNDIEVMAEAVFEQSPYDFVRSVRDWNSPGATIHYPEFSRELADDPRAVASETSDDLGEDDGYDA